MRIPTVERPTISFRGLPRTSRGSVMLVAVEEMPIVPTGTLTVTTGAAYGHPVESQEREADVGQSIYIGQQYEDPKNKSRQ